VTLFVLFTALLVLYYTLLVGEELAVGGTEHEGRQNSR